VCEREDVGVDTLQHLAELAVVLGANVQPDQVVRVAGEVDNADLVRAVADAAYRREARFVDIDLADPCVQRSRIRHAAAHTLTYAPGWPEERLRELDQVCGAEIRIVSPVAAGLYDDLDPATVSRAQPPHSQVRREVEYRVNNTMVPGPTESWARSLRPALTPAQALSALWKDIAVACACSSRIPWRPGVSALLSCALAPTRCPACGSTLSAYTGREPISWSDCHQLRAGSHQPTSTNAGSNTRGTSRPKRSTPRRGGNDRIWVKGAAGGAATECDSWRPAAGWSVDRHDRGVCADAV
jgi:hypothetical protein